MSEDRIELPGTYTFTTWSGGITTEHFVISRADFETLPEVQARDAAIRELVEVLEEYVRDFGDNEDSDSQTMANHARALVAKHKGGE